MTIIDEEKKKESIKTGVINPVQRTHVGKKGTDENDSDNRKSTEPGIEGDLNSDSAGLRQHASDRFNTERFEMKEEESLNLEKCHGGEQTTKHLNTSVCTEVPLSGRRHVQTDLLGSYSGEAERSEHSDLKPGTSYTKEKQKCLSDSRCLVESEYEARKGGKHICKRGIRHVDILKQDEDRCYDSDDEATGRETNKFNVPEQPQPGASERLDIPTGKTFLTNRRPKLDKLPPSGLPPLRNMKGLQKLRDDQLARHSELRRKRLTSHLEVCDRQIEQREDFKNKYRHAQSKSGSLCQPVKADVWARAGKRRGRNNQLPDKLDICTQEDSSKFDRDLSRINACRAASPRSMCTVSPQVGSERDPLEGLDDLLADIERSLGERGHAESNPEAPDDSFWNIITPDSEESLGMGAKKQRKAGRRGRTKQEELQRDVDIMDRLLDELARPL